MTVLWRHHNDIELAAVLVDDGELSPQGALSAVVGRHTVIGACFIDQTLDPEEN